MAITFNNIQTFTNPSRSDAGVYGLLTNSGGTTNTTSALFGEKKDAAGVLSASQKETISTLETYVKDNVTGAKADSLLKDIEGLNQLMKFGNSSASFNALSQLLGSNSPLSSALTSGSLINQLV